MIYEYINNPYTCRHFSAWNICSPAHSPHSLPLGSNRLPFQGCLTQGWFTLPALTCPEFSENSENLSKTPVDIHIRVFAHLVSGFPMFVAELQCPPVNSLRFTSEVLLYFFFLPLCCWPISCLYLSSSQTKKKMRKISSNSSPYFRNDQQNST